MSIDSSDATDATGIDGLGNAIAVSVTHASTLPEHVLPQFTD